MTTASHSAPQSSAPGARPSNRCDIVPLAFTGGGLDRASANRTDAAWLAAQRETGLFLPFLTDKPLVAEGRIQFVPWRAEWDGAPTIFLGLKGDQALFATRLETETRLGAPLNGEFMEMRPAAMILPAADSAIAGEGRALLDWHRRHGFCPNCGHATDMRDGGWRRVCPSCQAEHFPRTDPVVIMLPLFEDKCLIGRNVRFVGGLYSAFAGFVEPGETVEEAVRRELQEEVNVTVGAIRYHRSQPWPFPSSLMLGCYADALSLDFRPDGVEIADAVWLTRDEARERLAGTLADDIKMPTSIAIAHHLIRDWVNAQT